MHDIRLTCHMIKVLLIYVGYYGSHVDAYAKRYAYGLLVSLLSVYEVMGFHIYIALVVLDWDYK